MDHNDNTDGDVSSGDLVNTEDLRLGTSGKQLLSRLLGPVADEVGVYLADNFRKWRWRKENFEKVAQRCEIEKEARAIDDKSMMPVSEGDAYRLTDACSLEDNETVQELWAGLITSAMNRERKTSGLRAFIDILKAIGPVEAGLLLVLYEISFPPAHTIKHNLDELDIEQLDRLRKEINQKNEAWKNELKILSGSAYRHFSDVEKNLAIQNLFRLRCIGLRVRRNLDSKTAYSALSYSALSYDPIQTAKIISERHEYLFKAVDYLEQLILIDSGTGSHEQIPSPMRKWPPDVMPESQFQLTTTGRSLISACMTDVLRRKMKQEIPT